MGFPILLGLIGLKCAFDLLSINAILRSVPRWPPGYHAALGSNVPKEDNHIWLQGRLGYSSWVVGQYVDSPGCRTFSGWKCEGNNMDTGTTLRIAPWQLPVYRRYPGSFMWKLPWVLILDCGHPGPGHMTAGSSQRSVCSYPPVPGAVYRVLLSASQAVQPEVHMCRSELRLDYRVTSDS